MPISLVRGSSQILDASIPASKFAAGLNLPLAQIAGGTGLIKSDGTVAFAANQDFGGFKATNLGTPTAASDATNKSYVDALINGFAIKRARVVATANIALSDTQTIDGVSVIAGDRVLLTGQTTANQNGLWVVAAGAWTRPTDWAAASAQKSTMFLVEEGTTNHDTKWIGATDAITVDTTSVTITQDASGTSYTNGNGLSLTGNVFAVKLLSTGGLSFDGSQNVQIALDGTNLSLSATGIKIANSGANGQVMIGNASNVAAFTALSGDIASITGAGVVTLAATIAKTANFVANEAPSGTINGVNTAFTMASAPLPGKEMLYLNGQLLFPGAGNDYTISGAAVTMLQVPRLTVAYWK